MTINRLWRTGPVALAAVLCLSQAAFAFNDVSNTYWADQYIDYLSGRNVITGYPDNTFRPERPVTRAEFAVMLAKSQNLPMANSSRFVDVPASHWASSAINAVANQGWIAGYSNGTFAPSQNISMAEMYAILAQAGGQSMLTDSDANSVLNKFSDAGNVPAWARRAVATVANQGVHVSELPGGRLYPASAATRASVATSLAKLVNTAWRQPAGQIATNPTTPTQPTEPQASLGTPVDVTGTLEATANAGEWAVRTSNGERYFLMDPGTTITGQSAFRVGNEIRLTGNIDKTNSTNSRWVVVPRTVAAVNVQGTTATVTGMLRPSTSDANAWVIETADHKVYRLVNPDLVKNDPLFRYGSNVSLVGSLRPDITFPTADGTGLYVSSIKTAQTGSQVSVTGTLKPTVEAGGWIVDTGTTKYVLLGADPMKNQSWFKSGQQVMVSGNVRTDIPTVYNEGSVLVVNTLQATPGSVAGAQQVGLYMPNYAAALGLTSPAVRIIEGPDVATKAVNALLDGPTQFEKYRGYYQAADLSKLNAESVTVSADGTANVVLEAPANFAFTSTASQAQLQDQVNRTLTQITGIKEVNVSVQRPDNTVIWTSQ